MALGYLVCKLLYLLEIRNVHVKCAIGIRITAFAVGAPAIPEVTDMETGKYQSLAQVVSSVYGHAMVLRTVAKMGQEHNKPLYISLNTVFPSISRCIQSPAVLVT
jgi:hypothetical protein